MNEAMVANELVRVAKVLVSSDAWEEVLELIKTKNHVGNDEFVDFCAEVWNGGVEQWVTNGHAEEFSVVTAVARRLGPKGQQLASLLSRKHSDIRNFESVTRRSGEEHDEQEYEALAGKLEDVDDWFYRNDDDVIAEFLEYLKR